MGIVILIVFAFGLYFIGRAVVMAVAQRLMPRKVAIAAQSTQSEASEVPSEFNWSAFEAPTFVRRGLPFPVLTEKVKAKRKSRKTKAALNPEVDSFPMGDWTTFSSSEGECHAH